MVDQATFNGAQRERTPTQQQHPPPDASRRPQSAAQAVHVHVHPSNFPAIQTQNKAPQDASGIFVHQNAHRGGNLQSRSIASPLQHYPPSLFQHNNYQGPYAIYPPHFPNTPPQTYAYAQAHGYAPHFSLESGQYFRPIMQAHSPLEGGRQLPLPDSPGTYPTTRNAPAYSPLPPPVASGSQQYHLLRYPSPDTPYHYNHAYQPNLYHWYYGSVPPGFTEGVPMHYQLPYFAPQQHALPSDLELRFSRVSIPGGHTPPEQPTAPLAAPSAVRPSQVSTLASVPPSQPERHAPPSPVNTSPRFHSERPLVRRPYHPNPPAHRSEWVMWVGNIPDDATHDEVWRFLTHPPSPRSEPSEPVDNGVSSIFLISRSNCAFVNYDAEEDLQRAIFRFNGQQIRSEEWRCPRLVCRARRKEDDLRAGVGGQRGMGVHTRYVREQKQREKQEGATNEEDRNPSMSSESGRRLPTLPSLSSNEEATKVGPSWQPGLCVRAPSSSSYSSTSSSFLSRYFPQRFFILKSLTQSDLDESVENGLWATQKHNEAVLDQAYRTSTDVILIFGANKSGEFYGYARMAGRVLQGERSVSWASHADPSSSSRGKVKRNSDSPSPLVPANQTFFTPSEHCFVEESPLPVTPSMGGILSVRPSPAAPHQSSAPAALGPHLPRDFSAKPQTSKFSPRTSEKAKSASAHLLKDFISPVHSVVLDQNAPIRAVRGKGNAEDTKTGAPALQPVQEENIGAISGDGDGDNGEEQANEDTKRTIADDAGEDGRQTWGQPFKVEWLCTDRLPFPRIRHLRNPWNRDREIKVSRDGTELEPGIGQQLVEEWQALAAAPASDETVKPATTVNERALKSTPALSLTTEKSRGGGT